jgi:prepilin-type processing-associated H-X9-DG protein
MITTQGRCSGMVPLLPYIDQSTVSSIWAFNKDWSDPSNAAGLLVPFSLMRCPSTPDAPDSVSYAKNASTFIGPGNAAFAPPKAGSTTTNILGTPLYPTIKCTPSGWPGDYAGVTQCKTTKNAAGAEIAFTNALITVPWAGLGSKGALRQNGLTPIRDIADGTSNTTLYSEECARFTQYFTGNISAPLDFTKATGFLWADSDNRITVTGTSYDGKSLSGQGPCVINCNNQTDMFSFHAGGVNMAYADGHVSFISTSIGLNIIVALVTKAGGERVDVP